MQLIICVYRGIPSQVIAVHKKHLRGKEWEPHWTGLEASREREWCVRLKAGPEKNSAALQKHLPDFGS